MRALAVALLSASLLLSCGGRVRSDADPGTGGAPGSAGAAFTAGSSGVGGTAGAGAGPGVACFGTDCVGEDACCVTGSLTSGGVVIREAVCEPTCRDPKAATYRCDSPEDCPGGVCCWFPEGRLIECRPSCPFPFGRVACRTQDDCSRFVCDARPDLPGTFCF